MHRKRPSAISNPVANRKKKRIRLLPRNYPNPIDVLGPLDQTSYHNIRQQQHRAISNPQQLSSRSHTTAKATRLQPVSPPTPTNIQRSAVHRTFAAAPGVTAAHSPSPNRLHRSSSKPTSHGHSHHRNVITHSNSQSAHHDEQLPVPPLPSPSNESQTASKLQRHKSQPKKSIAHADRMEHF